MVWMLSGIFDLSQSDEKKEKLLLVRYNKMGVPIVICESAKGNIMHNKIMVCDRKLSLYGSYNFSESAKKEDNFFFIDSDPTVAEYLDTYLETLYTKALGQPKTKTKIE